MRDRDTNPAMVIGVLLAAAILAMWFARWRPVQLLEFALYDLRMPLAALTLAGEPADDAEPVVLVEIDEKAVRKMGRWPWHRSLVAQGLQKIADAGPAAVGLDILYSEPEDDTGLRVIDFATELFRRSELDEAAKGPFFLQKLAQLRAELDGDARLAQVAEQAPGVVMPVDLRRAGAVMVGPPVADQALARHGLPAVQAAVDAGLPRAAAIVTPVQPVFNATDGIGHIHLPRDLDGVVRRSMPVMRYRNLALPSFPLRVAAMYRGTPLQEIAVDPGLGVAVGDAEGVPVTEAGEAYPVFRPDSSAAFPRHSFYDVFNDRVPGSAFAGKLVLVGVTAPGAAPLAPTPVQDAMPRTRVLAHQARAVLTGAWLRKPGWSERAEFAMILGVGLVLALALARLRPLPATGVFLAMLALLLGGSTWLLAFQAMWVPVAYPLLLLVLGWLAALALRGLRAAPVGEQAGAQAEEDELTLGLSYLKQGMPDMAFETLRRAPMDRDLLSALYSLAMAYEERQEYDKAVAVYEHMEGYDDTFRDIGKRKRRLLQTGDTMVVEPGSSEFELSTADGRRSLGRYELLRKLGQGAMGVVYLGRDPRINRTTAIKTFNLTEGMDPDEAQALKERFFREAESAGTLNHPNIVTIYDAGEEEGLAYIAMEYLKGKDLSAFTKADKKIPLRRAVGIASDVAAALDYAHEKGVVHRDIKPANIMIMEDGKVKITDFGIARVAATSQTQTGVVKGTPHYMSPEQISGKKVDGRTDIFSLGVLLYQMLTGSVPFTGENVAALMHAIINQPHADPRHMNPRVPKALVIVLNKALAKDRTKRYQRASEMGADLNKVGLWLDGLAARKAQQGQAAPDKTRK